MRSSLGSPALRRGTGRNVEIVEGADAVSRTAPAWLALTEQGGAATPFQSYTVARASSAAHIRRGERPRIVTVRRGGEIVLLFPTVVTSWFGLSIVRFLGDPLIQYGDILARRDLEPEDLAAAWEAATHPVIACFALFRRIRDDARLAAFLPRSAAQTNLQASPLVDLTRASILSSRDARELRRQRRRLEEHGPVTMRLVQGPEARPLLEEALRLKRSWLQTQGLVSAVVGDSTWELALREFCDSEHACGRMTVAVLSVGSRAAAMEAAFIDETCWYGFLGAFAPEFARMGPGQILTAECMDWTRKAGLKCYDQLPPSQPYKRRQATHEVTVRDCSLVLNPLGHLACVTGTMLPSLRSAFRSLPADLRRPAVALRDSLRKPRLPERRATAFAPRVRNDPARS